jgi:hypothetical protein
MTTNTNTQKLLEEPQEFLDKISEIQNQLTIPGILGKFPDDDQKRQFKQFRTEWKRLVSKPRINIARILVSELEANEIELNEGIDAINKEIKKLDDTIGFLNLLGRTIEILGRIIKL